MKKSNVLGARVCALSLLVVCATAVRAADTNEVKKLKPTIVTGSNIPTLDEVPIAPVSKIDREDIERSGAGTITEVLRRIPQSNSNGSFQETQSSSFTPGSAAIALRGLGAERTLILLNGRRITPYPFAQNFDGLQASFVDVNGIPIAAIDHIEILQDSGSAIYGSDAIAGVVNIILKRDYNGAEITSEFGDTTHKDLFTQSHSLLGGITSGKMSMMLAIDYYERNSQFLRDRPVSKYGFYSSASPLGTVFDPDPLSPDYGVPFYIPPTSDGTLTPGDLSPSPFNESYFNTNPNIVDWPEVTRYGAYVTFNYDITEKVRFFVDGWYRNNKTHLEVNPTPIFGDLDGFSIGPDNPYNPYPGFATPFRWRPLQAGRRINDIETDFVRLLPGVDIKINDDWNLQSAFLYNPVKTLDIGYNRLNAAAFQAALNDTNPATALNPTGGLGYQNNQATIDAMKVRTFRKATYDFWSYDIKVDGKLFDLPGGPVGIAFGGETRDEKMTDVPDSFSEAGLIVSEGGNDTSKGDRDSDALYAEVTIPFFSKENALPGLRSLQVQAAGRFEYYSDFGTTEKPKVGLKWQPVDSVALRGSYSEGFRAPTLPELFTAQSVGFADNLVDTARCAVDPSLPDCTAGLVQYKTIQGGNPNLDPENSESWFVGGSFQPPFIKGLTLNADYSHIDVTDVIANQSAQYIINNPGQFPGAVIRGVPQFPGDPGPIISIDQIPYNINKQTVDSVDMGINYLLDTDGAGLFEFDVKGTYYASFKRATPESGSFQYAGEDSFPKVKGNASVFWTFKRFSCGPTVNYTSGYHEYRGFIDPTLGDGTFAHDVGSWWTVDLQASYEFPYDTTVTLGCLNVADMDAPYSYLSEGYDNTVHDNRGRFVYARFNKKF